MLYTVFQIKVEHNMKQTGTNIFFTTKWFWGEMIFSVYKKSVDLGDHRKEIGLSATGEGGLAAKKKYITIATPPDKL